MSEPRFLGGLGEVFCRHSHNNAQEELIGVPLQIVAIKSNWTVYRGPLADRQFEVAKLVPETFALYPQVCTLRTLLAVCTADFVRFPSFFRASSKSTADNLMQA